MSTRRCRVLGRACRLLDQAFHPFLEPDFTGAHRENERLALLGRQFECVTDDITGNW
ncbi:MAG: hypothetical protein ACYTGR_00745 [Planctomycetota bacterium]